METAPQEENNDVDCKVNVDNDNSNSAESGRSMDISNGVLLSAN